MAEALFYPILMRLSEAGTPERMVVKEPFANRGEAVARGQEVAASRSGVNVSASPVEKVEQALNAGRGGIKVWEG